MKKLIKQYRPYKCLESINSLYIEKSKHGYISKPCCLYKTLDNNYVDTVEELLDNPVINEIREGFKDWRRPECNTCILDEKIGKRSRRLKNKNYGYDGKIRYWDIRPSNTCNLKCAMCNFSNSSKWKEDIDILEKYNGTTDSGKDRKSLDWDWIYEKCVDTAREIYIAGGEPFYMKNVHDFLDKLSRNQWNCTNTLIRIQTNGVSNTQSFLDILARFEKLEFSISIDAWGDVNELIRFPTNHDTFVKNTDELLKLSTASTKFNITVQAMNLVAIQDLIDNLTTRWNIDYDMHKLVYPTYLSISCLKPSVVNSVVENTSSDQLKNMLKGYVYDSDANSIMQNYLIDLDNKRNTNSKQIIPWCFE